MKKRGVSLVGLIFVFILFCFTLFVFLDLFDIIDVPEKYSIISRISKKVSSEITENTDTNDEEYISNNIKVVHRDETTTNMTEDEVKKIFEDYEQKRQELAEAQIQTASEADMEKVAESLNEGKTDDFYYNQLDSYAKMFYTALYNNRERLKTGTFVVDYDMEFDKLLHEEGGVDKLNSSYQLAINALSFDNPEIFYIDVKKFYLQTETTTYKFRGEEYRVKIGAADNESYLSADFSTEAQVDAAIAEIENVKHQVASEAMKYENVRDRIKYVHDFLVNHCEYDKQDVNGNNHNVYGTLTSGICVCEGYARAFKYILDEMNIPCIMVCGTGINSSGQTESHAWNYVKVDGQWYAVDTTWDDPVIIGGGQQRTISTKYFLVGSNTLFNDHTETGKIVGNYFAFQYPTLSVSNY